MLHELCDPSTPETPMQSVGLFRLAGDGMDCADLRDALDNGMQVSPYRGSRQSTSFESAAPNEAGLDTTSGIVSCRNRLSHLLLSICVSCWLRSISMPRIIFSCKQVLDCTRPAVPDHCVPAHLSLHSLAFAGLTLVLLDFS